MKLTVFVTGAVVVASIWLLVVIGPEEFTRPSSWNAPSQARGSNVRSASLEAAVSGSSSLSFLPQLYERLYLALAPTPRYTHSPRPGLVRIGTDVVGKAFFGDETPSSGYLTFPMWSKVHRISHYDLAVDVVEVHLGLSQATHGNEELTTAEDEAIRLIEEKCDLKHLERSEAHMKLGGTVPVHLFQTISVERAVLQAAHECLNGIGEVAYYIQHNVDMEAEFQVLDPPRDDEWVLTRSSSVIGTNAYAVHSQTTGEGSHIHVNDFAFDTEHPQLAGNWIQAKSMNLYVNEFSENYRNISLPREVYEDEDLGSFLAHGTQSAGMAVANEGECARGAAPGATWSGARLPHFQIQEPGSFLSVTNAQAMYVEADANSNSWTRFKRPDGLLLTEDGYMGTIWLQKIQERGETGTTFLWSAGNNPWEWFGVYANENLIECVGVGATMPNGIKTSYTTPGSVLVSAPSGEASVDPTSTPLTVDVLGAGGSEPGNCGDFSGTSCAAPQIAGVVALMQSAAAEAGRKLTNREVQLVLVDSASHESSEADRLAAGDIFYRSSKDPISGGLFSFLSTPEEITGYSIFLGFGTPDAQKAVASAEVISRRPVGMFNPAAIRPELAREGVIADDEEDQRLATFSVDAPSSVAVQFVTVAYTLDHNMALEVALYLVNEAGSRCLFWGFTNDPKNYDVDDLARPPPYEMTFKCVNFVGYDMEGEWTILATDWGNHRALPEDPPAQEGTLSGVELTFYGYSRDSRSSVLLISGAAVFVVGGTAGGVYSSNRRRRRSASKGKKEGKKDTEMTQSVSKSTAEAEVGSALPAMMAQSVGSRSAGSRRSKGSRSSKASRKSGKSAGSRTSRSSKASRGSRAGKSKKRRKSKAKSTAEAPAAEATSLL